MKQPIRTRRVDANIDDENELNQMESHEDLKFLREIQSNKVILNVGGARFEKWSAYPYEGPGVSVGGAPHDRVFRRSSGEQFH